MKRRRQARSLAESDADMLILWWGDQAYAEALDRDTCTRDRIPDPDRPRDHWIRVRRALRRRGVAPHG